MKNSRERVLLYIMQESEEGEGDRGIILRNKKPVNSVPDEFTGKKKRARDGTRTRGPDLGKVVLHQLSHSRISFVICRVPDTFDIILWDENFVNNFFIKIKKILKKLL